MFFVYVSVVVLLLPTMCPHCGINNRIAYFPAITLPVVVGKKMFSALSVEQKNKVVIIHVVYKKERDQENRSLDRCKIGTKFQTILDRSSHMNGVQFQTNPFLKPRRSNSGPTGGRNSKEVKAHNVTGSRTVSWCDEFNMTSF